MRKAKDTAIKGLSGLFGYFGYNISKNNPYTILEFHNLLLRNIMIRGELKFIQIGGNDGILADPIYSFIKKYQSSISGFILEPIPDLYEELVQNYKFAPTVTPINVGIHSSKKKMTIYRVRPELQRLLPKNVKGIASFDVNHWSKSRQIPSSDYMEGIEVDCVDINEFCRDKAVLDLDLLLIDTEGYDFEIILALDFTEVSPRMIRFEHGIRDGINSEDDFMKICTFLNSHGYQVIADSYDATAYKLFASDLVF